MCSSFHLPPFRDASRSSISGLFRRCAFSRTPCLRSSSSCTTSLSSSSKKWSLEGCHQNSKVLSAFEDQINCTVKFVLICLIELKLKLKHSLKFWSRKNKRRLLRDLITKIWLKCLLLVCKPPSLPFFFPQTACADSELMLPTVFSSWSWSWSCSWCSSCGSVRCFPMAATLTLPTLVFDSLEWGIPSQNHQSPCCSQSQSHPAAAAHSHHHRHRWHRHHSRCQSHGHRSYKTKRKNCLQAVSPSCSRTSTSHLEPACNLTPTNLTSTSHRTHHAILNDLKPTCNLNLTSTMNQNLTPWPNCRNPTNQGQHAWPNRPHPPSSHSPQWGARSSQALWKASNGPMTHRRHRRRHCQARHWNLWHHP